MLVSRGLKSSTDRGVSRVAVPTGGLWLQTLPGCLSGLDELPGGQTRTEWVAHWTGWPDRLGREV